MGRKHPPFPAIQTVGCASNRTPQGCSRKAQGASPGMSGMRTGSALKGEAGPTRSAHLDGMRVGVCDVVRIFIGRLLRSFRAGVLRAPFPRAFLHRPFGACHCLNRRQVSAERASMRDCDLRSGRFRGFWAVRLYYPRPCCRAGSARIPRADPGMLRGCPARERRAAGERGSGRRSRMPAGGAPIAHSSGHFAGIPDFLRK